MSEHIRIVLNSEKYKNAKREIRAWDCYLGDVMVGDIIFDPDRQYAQGDYQANVFDCENPSVYGWNERRTREQGQYNSLYAAKVGMLEKAKDYVKYLRSENARKAPAVYLPSGDYQFYPTPSVLAGKLIEGVKINAVKTVLEPSAGKGDLLECVLQRKKTHRYGREYYRSKNAVLDIDCIEIDPNLQAILHAKGFRVVHDDFLTFATQKRYDLIVMNPPFSEGDLHLIHAIELCENGGQIACILNAETIRNPCTNSRRVLAKKLKETGAVIRFIDDAFAKAERKAKVDVALVNISIPYTFTDETIWENLKKAREADSVDTGEQKNEVAPSGNVERLIREHDLMCEAGITLMRCYNGIAPHIQVSGRITPFITLNVGEASHIGVEKCDESHVNKFLRMVRAHYWQELFNIPYLRERMTSEMQKQYGSLIDEMRDYEFSKFNIRQVIQRIMSQITVGVEEAIVKCFEKLSNEHTYNENLPNDNIHYYNGWKTNKAHYVNMTCIIPTWGCFATAYRENSWGQFTGSYIAISPSSCFNVLSDLEKALNYLDNGETSDIDLMAQLEAAKNADRNRNIQCKYFSVTFFKKGTCHIKFHDKKIVDRLNIYVGRTKAWLPPSYGKVRYEEMDGESQRVVDEFQGREAYEMVMANTDDYLIDVKATPLLTA